LKEKKTIAAMYRMHLFLWDRDKAEEGKLHHNAALSKAGIDLLHATSSACMNRCGSAPLAHQIWPIFDDEVLCVNISCLITL
jgi:hypothetical protein